MKAIRTEKLTKTYGKARGISGLDLEVEQGEFVFLVGSRGAGSSTLLNLISGALQPDGGAVYLDQVNLAKLSRRQEKKLPYIFGKVPQDPALDRTSTVFENLCPPGRFGKMGGALTDGPLISKALGLVGMAGCEYRYPLEMSISQCKRVELAKAIFNSPPILLLDKITDKMDDDSIWDIFMLLNELNRRGTTVIMSTHAKQFVNFMRRRVVTLVDGRVVGDVQKGRFGDIV